MVFQLEKVVPWGRSFADYRNMFRLSDRDLKLKILDCGGGPASFNAEMAKMGNRVISCDPLYNFEKTAIADRINSTYPSIIEGLKTNFDLFVWQEIQTPEDLGKLRLAAMKLFLADFEKGREQKRYLNQELPNLLFDSNQFDLALCSHLLFTYSEQFSYNFHLLSIQEMCRVAKEVRIFPLVDNFTGTPSRHLAPLQQALKFDGYKTTITTVDYEFQKGGNQMLVINKAN